MIRIGERKQKKNFFSCLNDNKKVDVLLVMMVVVVVVGLDWMNENEGKLWVQCGYKRIWERKKMWLYMRWKRMGVRGSGRKNEQRMLGCWMLDSCFYLFIFFSGPFFVIVLCSYRYSYFWKRYGGDMVGFDVRRMWWE